MGYQHRRIRKWICDQRHGSFIGLRDKVGEFVIRQAFADWSRLQGPKKELQFMGIRIVDVLAT
jgi:hypothetical protein